MSKNQKVQLHGSPTTRELMKKLEVPAKARKYEKLSDNRWLRTGLQAVPNVGGPLDTFLFDEAEKAKKKRVDDSLVLLAETVDGLGKRIAHLYVEQHIEEYGYLLEKTLGLVASDFREEMRKAYIRAFSNFLSVDYSKLEAKEHFLNVLASLTPVHLLLLYLIGPDDRVYGEQPVSNAVRDHVISQAEGKGVSKQIAGYIFDDLAAKGLINHIQSSALDNDIHDHHRSDMGTLLLDLVKDQ